LDDSLKRSALLAATLGSFLTPFMGSAINIALPSIGKEFAMDAILLSWVATAYLLAAAVFLVPFGKIADIHGRKRVFGYGVLVYSIASLLCAFAPAPAVLIIFRALQGVGGAMIFGTGVAILTQVFPPGERGRVLGINVAAVYVGLSVGPFVGGLLTQYLGWRSIFHVNTALGVVVVAVVAWKLRGDWAEARDERFDLVGAAIYSLALVATMYGLSLLPSPSGAALLVPGALGLVAFARWELAAPNPLLNMNLFRSNRVFAFSNLAALINYSATAAVGFLLSLYLQYVKGLSPQNAGLVLISQPVIQAIFSPLAGRLSDRVESRVVASAGMGLTTLGLALLAWLSQATSFAFIMATLVILGLGFAFFSSPNTNAVMSAVEKRFYGVASATVATMRLLGQMFSMAVAMLLLALFVGKVQITPERHAAFLASLRVAFSVFAALCFVGIFASLARGRMHEE